MNLPSFFLLGILFPLDFSISSASAFPVERRIELCKDFWWELSFQLRFLRTVVILHNNYDVDFASLIYPAEGRLVSGFVDGAR